MSKSREHEYQQRISALDSRISEQEEELVQERRKTALAEAELAAARLRITLLEGKLDALAKSLFGKKSEALDANQLLILFQEFATPGPATGKGFGPEEAEAPRPRRPYQPRERHPRLPEHLPVVEEVLIPLEVQENPNAFRKIGEEASERLDYNPAQFVRLRTVRPKFVKIGEVDATPVIAPLPAFILEGSILTAGLLAQVLVAKYVDHLPLHRQEQIYLSRHGVHISRQVMSQWVEVGADWLQLIYQQIKTEALAGGYVQVDETPVKYLAPGHGKAKKGFLWVLHRPEGDVVFWWSTGRGAKCLNEFIPEDYKGFIQCDGYAAYDRFAGKRPLGEIQLVACWTHARRYFFKAKDNAPKHAGLILHLITSLYRIEKELRQSRAGPYERAWKRLQHSKPIIDRIRTALLLWKQKGLFTPASAMGEAIQYALNQWEWLLPYLENGRLEIDSNLVENAIRPTAIGKKNWLFFGSAEAGQRSAVIYTIVESCRKRGIDPHEYLRDIFTKLPTATNQQIKDLTPEGWQKARRKAAQFKAAA